MYEDEEGDFYIKDVLLIDDSNNVQLAIFKELFWNELMKALNELPENQRFVFIENEIEDKTLQKIAYETGDNTITIISC